MRTDDQYPSTFDAARLPQIMGGQDALLAMLENARERLVEGWTMSGYFVPRSGRAPMVCAVGAILAENFGGDVRAYSKAQAVAPPAATTILARMEQFLSQTAKDAIEILNEVTLEHHPEAGEWQRGPGNPLWKARGWSAPLEWVNQEWRSFGVSWVRSNDEVKAEILRLYDIAIDRRREQLAA